MPDQPCHSPLTNQQVLAYWLDEIGQEASLAVEEHLFACKSCSASLEQLTALGAGVRQVLSTGHIAAILPASFVLRMKAAGLRIREYRLEPHGSVNCTVTPDDDLVLAHLRAPLQDVRQLDAVIVDLTGQEYRLTDLSFNAADGEIILLPTTSELRPIQQATQRVQLLAVDTTGERLIGSYLFHHTAT